MGKKFMKPHELSIFVPIVIVVLLFAIIIKKVNDSKKTVAETNVKIENTMNEDQVKELKTEDITVGDGAEAVAGREVSVNYKGTLLDGTVFDSSYDRGTPFSFVLGKGEVIKGWDMGVAGMKVGGKRKLTIPPDLAYGESGAGNVIPPNSPLVFEVELLEVK